MSDHDFKMAAIQNGYLDFKMVYLLEIKEPVLVFAASTDSKMAATWDRFLSEIQFQIIYLFKKKYQEPPYGFTNVFYILFETFLGNFKFF